MTGPVEVATAQEASCVALTQQHRGHGVSTATYYLARALVGEGLHVLLGDLSQRPSALESLVRHDSVKNLVPWTPPSVTSRELPRLLRSARRRTAGLADVILLDADIHLLEGAGGLAAGLNYIVVVVEHTAEGASEAERMVQRLGGDTGGRSRVGVLFSRVEAPTIDDLPRRLESGVPVLGWLPADYLLAAGEAYSLKGGAPARPHEAYLSALDRLAQTLIRVVPLQRHVTGAAARQTT